MKKFLCFFILSLFTLPVFAKNTILVVGDSLSAGYGINVNQGWVSLLQQRLEAENYDYQVINASISGDTTSNGLARLPAALKQYRPLITIIELGGNDGLRGLPIAVIKKNIEQMVELTLAAKSKVVLLGVRLPPNYGPDYTQQFHQIYTDFAGKPAVTVVPLFLNKIDENRSLLQPDGIHPTAQSQQQLLDNTWPTLKKLLR